MSKPKWWTTGYEMMTSPLEKFQYLAELTNMSWHDCCDAWLEAKNQIPAVVEELAQLRRERDELKHALTAEHERYLQEVDLAAEVRRRTCRERDEWRETSDRQDAARTLLRQGLDDLQAKLLASEVHRAKLVEALKLYAKGQHIMMESEAHPGNVCPAIGHYAREALKDSP